VDRSELRGWLAASLNRQQVPKPLWDVLEYRGHVEDAVERSITLEEFLTLARSLLFYNDVIEGLESLPQREEARDVVQPPRFGGYEGERAQTLGWYLYLRAYLDPAVQKFRKDVLGGEVLSKEDAYRYVRQPRLARAGDDDTASRQDRIRDEPPSGHLTFRTSEGRGYEFIEYYPGSVLERLHNLCEDLIQRVCHPWSEAEAARFVLTGEAPLPKALYARADSFVSDSLTYGIITLKVEPWVAAQTVSEAYQFLQMQFLDRKPRALSRRNLWVARFVMEYLLRLIDTEIDQGTPRPSWRELMNRWNEENQDATYDDERQFNRDFYRAARAVVRPYRMAPLTEQGTWLQMDVSIPPMDEDQPEWREP
jgi:hypothetical protein